MDYLIIAIVSFLVLIMVGVSLLIWINRVERRHIKELKAKNHAIEEKQKALEIAEEYLKAINDNLEEIVLVRTGELQRSNAKLEQFAYLASHDLKQPLRTIRGFAQLLERDLQKKGLINERIEEYLQFITGGVSYMNQLIDNILRFGKYATTDGNIYQMVNLKDVIIQVQQNLRLQIQSEKAELTINVPDLEIKAVRIKIEQLLQNLLSNAITYRSKERPLQIGITIVDKGPFIEITFEDNGIGIPAGDQQMLFKVFNHTVNERKLIPKGIGLTICKKIVEQHGGEIWVKSLENEGSTFYVTLSKYASAQSDEQAA